MKTIKLLALLSVVVAPAMHADSAVAQGKGGMSKEAAGKTAISIDLKKGTKIDAKDLKPKDVESAIEGLKKVVDPAEACKQLAAIIALNGVTDPKDTFNTMNKIYEKLTSPKPGEWKTLLETANANNIYKKALESRYADDQDRRLYRFWCKEAGLTIDRTFMTAADFKAADLTEEVNKNFTWYKDNQVKLNNTLLIDLAIEDLQIAGKKAGATYTPANVFDFATLITTHANFNKLLTAMNNASFLEKAFNSTTFNSDKRNLVRYWILAKTAVKPAMNFVPVAKQPAELSDVAKWCTEQISKADFNKGFLYEMVTTDVSVWGIAYDGTTTSFMNLARFILALSDAAYTPNKIKEILTLTNNNVKQPNGVNGYSLWKCLKKSSAIGSGDLRKGIEKLVKAKFGLEAIATINAGGATGNQKIQGI